MPSIAEKLERDRRDLLDLSLRNTLLNFRVLKSRGLRVVDEIPSEVHRILVSNGRPMLFLPAPEDDEDEANDQHFSSEIILFDFDQPESNGENGLAARHTDNKLQTPHTSRALQKRLLNSYYAARTSIEEHGVNTLFLALGMLEWYEADQSEDPRRAPLVLIPVELTRDDVKTRFKVTHNGDDVGINLSLRQKLKHDFGIDFPVPDPEEELDVEAFFDAVASVVASLARWRVDRETIQLGFFSFTKLLMYEDLNPTNWMGEEQGDVEHKVIEQLLGEGFSDDGPVIAEERNLDSHLEGIETYPIWDADSSQTLAISDVLGGRNLIVQGPPGTGKSQTITNLVAEYIVRGKKILFVAEKMAALEVVKRRLENAHLGVACLELHSHKTNRKAVLNELRSTWELGEPRPNGPTNGDTALRESRDRLNRYCQDLHTPIGETSVTPYRAFGELVGLQRDLQGIELPRLGIRGAVSWTQPQFEKRVSLAEELQTLIKDIGLPKEHPFWGSKLAVAPPSLIESAQEKAQRALESRDNFREAAGSVSATLGLPAPESVTDVNRLLMSADRAMAAPRLERVAVANAAWIEKKAEIESSIEIGQEICQLRGNHKEKLLAEAWDEDVLGSRKALAVYGKRWWRILAKDYRTSIKEVRGLVRGELPKSPDARLALLDAILEAQRLTNRLNQNRDLVRTLLGPLWRDFRSDWHLVEKITAYLTRLHHDVAAGVLPNELVGYLAKGRGNDDLLPAAKQLSNRKDNFLSDSKALLELLTMEEEEVLPDGLNGTSFDQWLSLFEKWRDSAPRVVEVVRLNDVVRRALSEGLDPILSVAFVWPESGRALANLLKKRWYEALVEHALQERRSLAVFHGPTHEETLKKFRELDSAVFFRNRAVVASAHWRALPESSGIGQTALLRREFEKRRRHLPIRRLMEQAGQAVQSIKPVFMMSPLSVAAYLPPQGVSFDLVIFDEASQVTPVDAYGAILRGNQSAVVGDSKQLPPTPFFSVMSDGPDEDEVEGVTSDLESILGLFASQGAPSRMLRWHYRSRHESLIAVSNHEFYDNKLVVLPSPERDRTELGLVYRYLPDSAYEPGRGLARNPTEARHVARAAMDHARRRPDLTLGVAAFSRSQQQTILDHLEALRREDPTCEGFFASHPEEPFFVKNLENVQGDERDVIFISVGYGRTGDGHLSMNFGPLNNQGGERRLNVLITRARYRCEVFTNLTSEDLDLRLTQAQGVVALKRFLKFADTGILDVPRETGLPIGSEFEAQVADRLMASGCDVELQVGTGGFFVDIGIRDPDLPGRFLLGVECDGASYHSAAWARDRDRIRQDVLEGLGWRIHRVWSTDWFQHPDRELDRVLDVVREELSIPVEQRRHAAPEGTTQVEDDPPVVRNENGGMRETEITGAPYEVATPEVILRGFDLHQVNSTQTAKWIKEVVDVESPVHFNEVGQRIISAAGIRRLGSRIEQNLWRGVRRAESQGNVVRKGKFLWAQGQPTPVVRDRSELPNSSRKIDYVCDEEIAEAVRKIVEASVGADPSAVTQQVCRMLGFARTTGGMKNRIEDVIRSMVASGALAQSGRQLSIPS